jgi:phosphoserine aminotransferase
MSHRGPEFTAVIEEANALMHELLATSGQQRLPRTLWLTGGASTQFFMVPMNLLDNRTTRPLHTSIRGVWANKAIKEAKAFGNVEVARIFQGAELHVYSQRVSKYPKHAKYLHLTSNNTIFGTQIPALSPSRRYRLCATCRRIFLAARSTCANYGLIYAGAQKNLGPAGVTTVVIVREDMLGKVHRYLPTMLDYRTFIAENSLYNTPPVFPIYVSMLTMRWIKKTGGLKAMHRRNKAKAALLYNEIDANPLFTGTVAKEDRSLMNICFVMTKGHEALEKEFLKETEANGMVGLKGHRSVGGFRASTYNALPKAGVQALVDLMQDFARRKG